MKDDKQRISNGVRKMMLKHIDNIKHGYTESHAKAVTFRKSLKKDDAPTLEEHVASKIAKDIREDKKMNSPKMTPETMKRFLFKGQKPHGGTLDGVTYFLISKGYKVSGLELTKKD